MKRLFLKRAAAALLIVTTMSVSAQQPQQPQRGQRPAPMEQGEERVEREKLTPEQVAEKMTEKMSEKLSLTADQTKKIYKVNLDYAKKKAEAAELDKKHLESVVSLLNPEQTVTLVEMKSKMRRGPKGPMRGRGPQQMGPQGDNGPQGGEQMRPQRGPKRGPKGGERPEGECDKKEVSEE